MAWWRWAATALCLVVVVAAQALFPAPPVPSPVAFQSINDDRFSQLRRQAMQFVDSRPRQGFQFVDIKILALTFAEICQQTLSFLLLA